ncbi:uncharacterized protein LOC135346443 [Halichondria panicea]|uniref:uncharacterized protein LOC135346443 n=1 Tax=Halichondria panicea TaxID=6063 RepID=UPI00312BA466
MPMYALATVPIIKRLHSLSEDIDQVWYADDAAAGKIVRLQEWWTNLSTLGPKFGYFPNPQKTWLVTKEKHLSSATTLFANTGVQVTSEGRPYLGAALGTEEFVTSHVQDKVGMWSKVLDKLTVVAETQPHAAHAAFTHGLSNKWSYLTRTIQGIGNLLEPLESTIRMKLLPTLTGQPPPSDEMRDLLALPARLGGIAISNPTAVAEAEFSASTKVAGPLKNTILQQSFEYATEVAEAQVKARNEVRRSNREHCKHTADTLKQSLSTTLKRSMDLAQEKGASNWLTSLPIQEFGFALHKGAFRDALSLRYSWQPSGVPSSCACGKQFSVDHALSYPKGGFTITRHNEIRDLTANLLTEICSDVCVEPELQPVSGEELIGLSANVQDGARLDIACNGFWGGRFERTYLDVRVFNPHAKSNQHTNCYRKHELEKKRQYEQRVRDIEHASFTPLVMSATGGMANQATVFYKRLASNLAIKSNESYSRTLSWLRSRITFSLLRSAIQCIRGSRSSRGQPARSQNHPSADLANSELNFNE